jgi:hypothetical protein
MTPSSSPIATLPTASKRDSLVTTARLTPTSAQPSPSSAPASSSRTTGSSGLLERRMNAHHDCPARTLSASWMAVRSDQLSSAIATSRAPNAQAGDSIACGWRSFS